MLRAILGYTVTNAEVAELADAPALGAGGRKAVGVRVPSSAPLLDSTRLRLWLPPHGCRFPQKAATLPFPDPPGTLVALLIRPCSSNTKIAAWCRTGCDVVPSNSPPNESERRTRGGVIRHRSALPQVRYILSDPLVRTCQR